LSHDRRGDDGGERRATGLAHLADGVHEEVKILSMRPLPHTHDL